MGDSIEIQPKDNAFFLLSLDRRMDSRLTWFLHLNLIVEPILTEILEELAEAEKKGQVQLRPFLRGHPVQTGLVGGQIIRPNNKPPRVRAPRTPKPSPIQFDGKIHAREFHGKTGLRLDDFFLIKGSAHKYLYEEEDPLGFEIWRLRGSRRWVCAVWFVNTGLAWRDAENVEWLMILALKWCQNQKGAERDYPDRRKLGRYLLAKVEERRRLDVTRHTKGSRRRRETAQGRTLPTGVDPENGSGIRQGGISGVDEEGEESGEGSSESFEPITD